MKSFIILLDGAKGSGKSTVGKMLKGKFEDVALINFDSIRHLTNIKAVDKNNAITFEVILSMIETFILNNINVIIDSGVTNERMIRLQNLAKENDNNIYLYHLFASKDILWSRIQERPQCKNPDRERFDYIYDLISLKDLSQFIKIDTFKNKPADVVDIILKNTFKD